MALKRKTLNFLPTIFRTDTNRKFLGSTVDQLVNEPEIKRINGYVGRQFSPTFKPDTNYVVETDLDRQNYQLEPSFVVRNTSNQVTAYGNYVDLINKIDYYGGQTDNHDRLFESDFYTFDPQIDLDKFVNYSQYYWLPTGPEQVVISSQTLATSNTYALSYSSGSLITNQTGAIQNPTIVVKRGETYTFNVGAGSGNLWIQSEPGQDGLKDYAPGSSTRDVYGVTNNGTSTITFTVPQGNEQNNLYQSPFIGYVDYALTERFTDIDNGIYRTSGGTINSFSGETFYPNDVYVVFTQTSTANGDWTDRTGAVVPTNRRRGIWRIRLNSDPTEAPIVRMRLEFVRSIPIGTRFEINKSQLIRGRVYRVNMLGLFEVVPNLTAASTTLYYQNDTQNISGQIKIVDNIFNFINVDSDIVGQPGYTSPQGIVFTNGLKIRFDDTINPSIYRNRTFIVEGVGTAISLIDYATLVTPEVRAPQAGVPFDFVLYDQDLYDETYSGSLTPDYIVCNRATIDRNAWARINRWTHIDVIKQSFAYNNLPIVIDQKFCAKRPIIEFKPNLQLFNNGKKFFAIVNKFFELNRQITVAGQNVPFDNISILVGQTFRTIRSYNIDLQGGDTAIFAGDNDPQVRPRVYNIGFLNQSTSTTFDASLTGTVSGVRNKFLVGTGTRFLTELEIGDELFESSGVYVGRVVKIKGDSELEIDRNLTTVFSNLPNFHIKHAKINLTTNSTALVNDIAVCLSGVNSGNSFYYSASTQWILSQRKRSLNQEPLFDIVNDNGISLSQAYTFSTFAGTKLFSYRRGSGAVDSVLGFSLSYSGIGDFIGDIDFVNNYSADTFKYRLSAATSEITLKVDTGFIKRLVDNSLIDEKISVWNRVIEPTHQYQLVSGIYDGLSSYFEIGVMPNSNGQSFTENPKVKLFINNRLVIKNSLVTSGIYTIQNIGERIAIQINPDLLTKGDRVDIVFYSDRVSNFGFYQIPVNLEYNSGNADIGEISLGQFRNHLKRIGENLNGLFGDILANNNLRDINYSRVAGTLLQHSAPVVNSMAFLLSDQLNVIDSIDFARREYTRFKNKFIETIDSFDDLVIGNPAESVDRVLARMNQVKTDNFPWYYSDMVPTGNRYVEKSKKVTNVSANLYALSSSIYSNITKKAASAAVLIYKNNSLLIKDQDYVIDSFPNIRIKSGVQFISDIITIREYSDTDGSFVPETPTKLGLYPKFLPGKFLDNTYRTAIDVIQGHDGSLMPAFNDFRDDIILELERRIYNNIKVNYDQTKFDIAKHQPGFFRNTEYSLSEFNQVISKDFLKWVGSSQVNYTTNQYFQANDQFSYNYSRAIGPESEKLPGGWRGIYRYFFDTDRPHTHPWEMLGHTEMPSWWTANYSWTNPTLRAALILAVTNGVVSDPVQAEIDIKYARPNFANYVPVDNSGNLISPLAVLVQNFNSETFSRSWSIGDYGPVESAWRRSSEYPFAVQRAMALLKPARYFGACYDVSRYQLDPVLTDQVVDMSIRKRGSLSTIILNGQKSGTEIYRASGYLNWAHGYLVSQGLEPDKIASSMLGNASVNLSYKMAGFSDKQYLTVLAEQFTPGSLNNSVIIPDENYLVHLNRSVPVAKIVYSAVIVQKTNQGWTVSGYDQRYPFFNIIPSDASGEYYTIEVLSQRAIIYKSYRREKLSVPYGFEFNRVQQVVDFLVSYERFLLSQGFEFDQFDPILGIKRDWVLAAKEFLTWNLQGWPENNILVLSPVMDVLAVNSNDSVVDSINTRYSDSRLAGVNFNALKNTEITMLRDNGRSTISTLSGQTIAFADLNLVQYEHVLILDNVTVFNDVIYKSEVGNRQYRLKLIGGKTQNWDGELTPPGFVYNNGDIQIWQAGVDYRKGQIVSYKNKNYTALQPVVAATIFDFQYWSLLDRPINAGLVPNLAHNAGILENVYDIDNQPLNETFAKFSNALIGYRNRSYLEDLGIDQVAQSKFYQGYIKDKGTQNAITALSRGEFDGMANDITIYEEWGARLGEYGAIDANPEISVKISESVYNKNPINIEFLDNNQKSTHKLFTSLYGYDLYSRTLDYKPQVFLNRPLCNSRNWKIEIFGDGILCGKIANNIYTYGIQLQGGITEFSFYSIDVIFQMSGISATTANIGDVLEIQVNSIFPTESLVISIEPLSFTELPKARSPSSHNLNFTITSPNPAENLIYRVDEVLEDDQPNSVTGLEQVLACRYNKSDGRVALPPDYLMYLALSNEFDVAITTRSVTGSDTAQLVSGNDGVNGVWPDDIEADIVLINHGHNDARNNVPLSVYRYNLELLRTRLGNEKKIVWVTPTEVNSTVATWEPLLETPLIGYVEVMKSVAAKYGDYVADSRRIKNWKLFIDIDGVHPIQAGYTKLVNEVIVPTVRQVLIDSTKSSKPRYEDDLQTGGYALVDEVDSRYFDISKYRDLNIIDDLYTGYKLWVAKDFDRDWQVFSTYLQGDNQVIKAELDNDSRFTLTTTKAHNLVANDLVAIRNFDTVLDGFYQVFRADKYTFTVTGDTLTNPYLLNNIIEDRTGELFDFTRLRFNSYQDLQNYKPKRAWLDRFFYSIQGIEDANGCWTVYDFAVKWAPLYNQSVTEFEAKAYNILPVYLSNRPFNVVIDGESTIRYGLYRTVDPDGLAYWVDECITLNRDINNVNFLNAFFTAVASYQDYDRDLTNEKEFDSYTRDIAGCSLFRYRGLSNVEVLSTVTGADSIKFVFTSVNVNEPLVYSIEPVTDHVPGGITKDTTLNSTQGDLGRDLLYVDRNNSSCEEWAVFRPEITDIKYELVVESELTYSNVYSIVSRDCQATECYTVDEFAKKYATYYGKTVANFKAKATELLPLYNSNRKFSYSSGSKSFERYGLFRTADTLGLAYWCNQALDNSFTISSSPLLINFFTAIDTDYPGYGRHLTRDKQFDATTTDLAQCPIFRDRGETFFNKSDTISLCISSVEPNEVLYYRIVPVSVSEGPRVITMSGNLAVYSNVIVPKLNPTYSWQAARLQEPTVDLESVNNLYLYSEKDHRFLTRLDILDPAKGRLLGTAQQDLDYTTSVDPAKYRTGSTTFDLPIDEDYFWGKNQVGVYWWNMDSCRYIHYEQSSLDYRTSHWAELFPGSTVEVYEWIESNFLPSLYRSNLQDGIPLYEDDSAYSEATFIDPATNGFITKYFYWVRAKEQRTNPNKRHSTLALEDIITNPVKQGIPYIAALKNNSVSVYNIGDFIKANDSILYLSSKRKINQNIIHSDFQLIQEGNPNITIPVRIENKIIDSLVGRDLAGAKVPDPLLKGINRFGLDIRPRQTVIKNVKKARENLVKWVNSIFADRPLAFRIFDKNNSVSDNFYAKQELPDAAEYDVSVATFADIASLVIIVGATRRILVLADETLGNYWSIYARTRSSATDYTTRFVKKQAYDVTKLWKFVNWYEPGFSDQTVPTYIVDKISDTYQLDLKDGDVVKVKNSVVTYPRIGNGTVTVPGQAELFQYHEVNGQLRNQRVGLERGTVEISFDFYKIFGFDSTAIDTEVFDFEPAIEMRYILKGLKEDVFIEDLDHLYDAMMFYLIDYILSEQKYIDWFFKTSFISVLHSVSELNQTPSFVRDRQSSFQQYINEVKPYRTKIREYRLGYTSTDVARIGLTDFDVPAYYDSVTRKYLVPNGDTPSVDSVILNGPQYQNWRDNHKYTIGSIELASTGYGYFSQDGVEVSAPDVVIIRTDTETGSNARAISSASTTTGSLQKIYMTSTGSNYTQTPIVQIEGNGGTDVTDNDYYHYRIVSRGSANTNPVVSGLYDVKNSSNIYTQTSAGMVMHRIRRVDGRIVFTQFYAINSVSSASYQLAYDLGQTTRDNLVVVYAVGNIGSSRLNNGLERAMTRSGASEIIYTNGILTGGAYILIGVPGIGPGQGIELYNGSTASSTNAWAMIEFKIKRGRVIPINLSPRVSALATAFAFPASPTLDQVYNYANRSWKYNGRRWVSTSKFLTILENTIEVKRAIAVPRLTNKTTRKIKTVIRLDRVQYTTKVVDWAPGTGYPINTYLSYRGRGYVVKANMPASETFNFAFVRPVGINQPATSNQYQHAFFDNANDRIAAFYVPTVDNGNIPKALDRLITGVRDSWTTYNSVTGSIPLDTTLIGDTFGSNVGTSAGNISLVGGQFIDVQQSHAPEELIPGITFDAVSIKTVTSNSTDQGFRVFIDMNKNVFCTEFDPTTVTTLAAPVLITDTTITVADGSKLSVPNPLSVIPGIIELNGERISYYTKVGNVLGQIRRGFGGTGIAAIHQTGSRVEDVSVPARSGTACSSYPGPHNF